VTDSVPSPATSLAAIAGTATLAAGGLPTTSGCASSAWNGYWFWSV